MAYHRYPNATKYENKIAGQLLEAFLLLSFPTMAFQGLVWDWRQGQATAVSNGRVLRTGQPTGQHSLL